MKTVVHSCGSSNSLPIRRKLCHLSLYMNNLLGIYKAPTAKVLLNSAERLSAILLVVQPQYEIAGKCIVWLN